MVRALGLAARLARDEWNGPLVGITGSAGKTGTKEIVAGFLGVRFRVGKTIGNLNNHIGLPLTLLRLPADAEVAVVEMGMNHAGEIRQLAAIARPQIGVITNVGYAHMEAFQSIDGIVAAKGELIEGLQGDGVAVLNADDERALAIGSIHPGKIVTYGLAREANIRAEHVVIGTEGSEFSVRGVCFRTKLTGKHAVSNILAGLAVASIFEIPFSELAEVAAQFTASKMRGERRRVREATVIDDSYNSNPEAARSMIDVLLREPATRRIAVLGEMLELGRWAEKLHRDLAQYAVEQGIDVLVGISGASRWMVEEAVQAGMSENAAFFFDDPESAGEFLREFVKPGDAVLFKGSRGTHVEKSLAKMEE
jgi:UDP-N-acetylmuramoyl-tripeptide--D-alanyl-D-alanine ligase